MKKRILAIIFIVVLVFQGCTISPTNNNSMSNTSTNNNQAMQNSQSDSMNASVQAYLLFEKNTQSVSVFSSTKNQINLELNLIHNINESIDYQVIVLLNNKQVKYKVGNSWVEKYTVNTKDKHIKLPFTLDLKNLQSGMYFIDVLLIPSVKNSNAFNFSLSYTLIYKDGSSFKYDNGIEIPGEELNLSNRFSFQVNQNKNDLKNMNPVNTEIKAKPGEKLNIPIYFSKSFSKEMKAKILMFINYSQVLVNGKNFAYVNTEDISNDCYIEVAINAPKEKGTYLLDAVLGEELDLSSNKSKSSMADMDEQDKIFNGLYIVVE